MDEQERANQDGRRRLLNCRLCGKEISPYSPFCRNCGHPQGSNLAICLLILFLVFLLASYMAFVIHCALHVDSLPAP